MKINEPKKTKSIFYFSEDSPYPTTIEEHIIDTETNKVIEIKKKE